VQNGVKETIDSTSDKSKECESRGVTNTGMHRNSFKPIVVQSLS